MSENAALAQEAEQTADDSPIIEDLLAHIGESEIAALKRALARVLVDQAIAECDSQANDSE